ncbi:MAG: cytochrome c biogenesis protein CcsA [Spirochaetales bacterium]|nr:cytochrome c biogenesis protein CcsA [Spirochaetales bacterium]
MVGFITLLIAHFIAGDGDTIEQMSAILNSRFWLAVHVVTISLGYIAAFVAGLLGVIAVLSGSFPRGIDRRAAEELARMLYATTCFALLLTFIGTVLGGLWADNAWGRFWGWDPKENGALLIILWNTIMLYARRVQQVGLRGFSIMAVFGNIVTAWSWFGVNQLGIGLHAYGFTDSGNLWLSIFIISQLAICCFGLLSPRPRKR